MTDADIEAEVAALLDRLFRDQWGRLLSIVIGQTGDIELAEECVQEAFTQALDRWAEAGIPDSPQGWLVTTARRRAVDRIRRARVGRDKLRTIAATEPAQVEDLDQDQLDSAIGDERLRLLFTCCHPALSIESQAALALRTLLGLSVAEIARGFGVGEAAMAKRLTRTKLKIRDAGIPYRVPPAAQLTERTGGVLGAIYLLSNEGYAATAGDQLTRSEFLDEALRLADLVADLMPDDPEVIGLQSLLILHRARGASRTSSDGMLIPLEEQDRSRWDRTLINDGLRRLVGAGRRDQLGPYQLQAMIAGGHLIAERPSDTDWARIVILYDALLRIAPSPSVRLNRIVAIAMRDGPDSGLRMLDEAAREDLPQNHLLAATRADLLRRLGRRQQAEEQYRKAIALTANDGERRYLLRRISELG
ncbi:MAG TPA: sigma-70 family RNA polymerase sigma factor [Microlunatus sp.]